MAIKFESLVTRLSQICVVVSQQSRLIGNLQHQAEEFGGACKALERCYGRDVKRHFDEFVSGCVVAK